MTKIKTICTGCVPIDSSILEIYAAMKAAIEIKQGPPGPMGPVNPRGGVTSIEPVGTPSEESGVANTYRINLNDGTHFDFSVKNGKTGTTPDITIGTVTTGEPGTPVVVTITGTPEAPVLNITIPRGSQGNTGSSVDYPYELVNNLTTEDATKGLSAAQGAVLDGKISQLSSKVTDNTNDIDSLQNQLDNYRPIVIEGNVTNAPDEEDITTDENDLLKLADRAAHTNYLGYVILRKGKTFASQVTNANTVYEIRYDFDLGGSSVTIPERCVLKFNGGRLNNGKLLLSPFDNIVGTAKDDYCLNDVYVSLNKRCTMKRLGLNFTNPTEDLITYETDRVGVTGGYFSDTNVLLKDILINSTVSQGTSLVNAITILSNYVSLTNDNNERGAYNFNFVGIDFKGRFNAAFYLDNENQGNWINAVNFDRCCIVGARYGWYLNPRADDLETPVSGKIDCISIANSMYQYLAGVTMYAIAGNRVYDLKVTGSRFWDFPATSPWGESTLNGEPNPNYEKNGICKFDSDCFAITFDKFIAGGETKPYVMVMRDGANASANSQIRLGPQLYNVLNLTKYITLAPVDPDDPEDGKKDIKIADLFAVPDGMYYLDTADSVLYWQRMGIRLRDSSYTKRAYITITKNYGNILAVVYTSHNPAGSYNYGVVQVLSTILLDQKVKDCWDVHLPADSIAKSVMERLNSYAFPGESHFCSTYLIPTWWDSVSSKWRGADGYTAERRRGSTSQRPSLAYADGGCLYFDTTMLRLLYWKANRWVLIDCFDSGTTTQRPSISDVGVGYTYFDTTLKTMIVSDGTNWINMDGTPLLAKSGATADRPSASNAGVGYTFFDTDLGKMIVSDGVNWINLDGTPLTTNNAL